MARLTFRMTLPGGCLVALTAVLLADPTRGDAAVFAGFDAERHERFASDGTTPNPGFLANESRISGVGLTPAVLITPQHYLTAAHIGAGGLDPRFRGGDGEVRTFTTDTSPGGSLRLTTTLPDGTTAPSDLQLHRLSAPIPDTYGIRPLSLLGGSPDDIIGRELLVFAQNNQAGRNVADAVGLASFDQGDPSPTVVVGFSFDTDTDDGVGGLGPDEIGLTSGDSGHAALLWIGDEWVVVGTHFGIDISDGQDPSAGDRYDSFSSLVTPYLSQINAFTSSDGFSVSVVAVPEPAGIAFCGCLTLLAVAWLRRSSLARS